MFKRILVCLDGSDLAEQILPYAIETAKKFDSKITLLEITSPPTTIIEPMLGYYNATSLEKFQRDESQAVTYLEKLVKRLQKQGLEVDYATSFGSPGEAIVHYAAKHQVSLIALCTHGHSGLGRMVFGSVAEHVIRHSTLPILVRKPEKVKE